jgi:hypothetical protein
MRAHHQSIDLSPFEEGENFVNSQSSPDHDSALNPDIPSALSEGLKAEHLGSGFGIGAIPRPGTRAHG